MFELLNEKTPFHSKNRAEFEEKVAVSSYVLRDEAKDKLTIECILFMTNCMQDNEEDRKAIEDLVEHPYITMPFDKQQKLSEKAFKTIFKGESNNQGSRARSAAPRLRGGL